MGSSPLTRGKRRASSQRWCQSRLIPAHAGKTSPTQHRTGPRGAHPRSRGENYATARNPSRPSGSSPLTRGKHAPDLSARPCDGLIPAHAGKTQRRRGSVLDYQAHPRSRGENHGVQSRITNQTGSSPLTRGKHARRSRRVDRRRLIPAHAGKTRSRHGSAATSTAHPRSRGENAS